MERGAVIAGFRIERTLGSGSFGTVYEATQVSLARPVALRLIPVGVFADHGQLESFDERQRRAAALHHPSLLPSFAAGEWDGGRFVASRLVRGTNMGELLADGGLPDAGQLDSLAEAMALVHAAGLDCGGLQPVDVLIDGSGRAYLAEVGLRSDGGNAAQSADQRALEQMRSRISGQRKSRRRLYAVTGAALCLLVAALALFASRGVKEQLHAPGPQPGTVSLGSSLHDRDVDPIGCSDPVSPNTPSCTMEPLRIGGEPLKVSRSGVIRSWSAFGASGELALQVVRRRGQGTYVAAFTQPVKSGGGETVTEPAELAVHSGDRIALRLGPGATIGSDSIPGARFRRWDGGLTPDLQRGHGTSLRGELQLRVDVEFGARPDRPQQLLGKAAAKAAAGDVLFEIAVSRGERGSATVKLVELPGGVAIDVFDGTRLARIPVSDADPTGQPSNLLSDCGVGSRGFCLRWQNPGADSVLFHAYSLDRDGRVRQLG